MDADSAIRRVAAAVLAAVAIVAPAGAAKRRRVPKAPPVSAKVRAAATESVQQALARAAELDIQNPAALVPFFEQLYRSTGPEAAEPLRILHFGDSHTATDDWTGSLRALLQARFGDGGGGYSLAGRPFAGYRRLDVKGGETRGWKTVGLLKRDGDGLYGLGGVGIATSLAGESVYLEADCHHAEIYYLQQPDGGEVELYDNGEPVARISTSGELGAGYFRHETRPGPHRLEIKTLDRAPVRLFGWVTENDRGLTYESLGINGAQASVVFRWDEALLASHISRRNPALIVLAYGTNEASSPHWTAESYREMFSALVARLRQAAPTASILVIGPPDRYYRYRGRWLPFNKVERVVEVQRQAALANGCAFWDTREKMGGPGAMRQWVLAGLAQYDHVHFTSSGYRRLGYVLFRDLMYNYGKYARAREELAAENGQAGADR